MGAAIITNAFQVSANLSWTWVKTGTNQYLANNGFFDFFHGPACSGDRRSAFCSRRSQISNVTISDYLAENPTDFHIFQASPTFEASITQHACQKDKLQFGSIEDVLMKAVLGENALGKSFLDSSITSVLSQGLRPIFSAAHEAVGVNFHMHSATWAALTHGRKAWWLGPATLATTFNSMGNNELATSPCKYLGHERPHPDVKFVVQEPGEILIFGEGVSHATCTLEPSIMVGNQMGFYDVPYLTSGRPVCKSQTLFGMGSFCGQGQAHSHGEQRAQRFRRKF
jgi:hypothetical protein